MGTCLDSNFTFDSQVVHHSSCASYRWNFASNVGPFDLIRCILLLIKSIVVQLDNGTLLNDEDLPPLPDKMEKQLRKRLELFELYDEE